MSINNTHLQYVNIIYILLFLSGAQISVIGNICHGEINILILTVVIRERSVGIAPGYELDGRY
jgi:hypothetical protein